jgi:hypothetical protein
MNPIRRSFMLYAVGASSVCASSVFAQKAAPEMVKDTDAVAVAIGYSSDATKVDTKKYPQYLAGQSCSGCTLYGGAAKDASGPCPVFAGKAVAAKGWCSAWAKKA